MSVTIQGQPIEEIKVFTVPYISNLSQYLVLRGHAWYSMTWHSQHNVKLSLESVRGGGGGGG